MPPAISPPAMIAGEDHPDQPERQQRRPQSASLDAQPLHRRIVSGRRAAGYPHRTCRRIGRGADRVRRAGHDGGGDGRQPAPRRVRGHRLEPDPRPRRRPGRARAPGRPRRRPRSRRPSDVVVCCVSDTPDVEAVLFGDDGVAQRARARRPRHRLLDDLAQRHRGFAQRLADQGIELVDAPVSGGSEGARNATLTIFVGGEPEAIERARPVLEAMGKTITPFGPPGSGQAVKAVNQVDDRGRVPGVAEGIVLAMQGRAGPGGRRRRAGRRGRAAAGSSRTAAAG